MALKPFYESEADVPEPLKDHYKADDAGRHTLVVDAVDGYSLENVSGLKSTLGKLKERATAAETDLKAYRTLERDPDEITAALDELENLKASTNTQSESERISQLQAELEKTRTAAKREREKEIAPVMERNRALTDQLKSVMIDNALTEAITQAGGSVPLLLRALKDEVRAAESDNGGIEVQIVDRDGTPRVTGADLKPMGFAELVAEKRADEQFAPAFGANGHSGGGTRQSVSNGAQGSLTPETVGSMTMADYVRAREQRQI